MSAVARALRRQTGCLANCMDVSVWYAPMSKLYKGKYKRIIDRLKGYSTLNAASSLHKARFIIAYIAREEAVELL